MRLSDDWQSADLIAQHYKDKTFLLVQLKSRLTFSKRYIQEKNLYVAFPYKEHWYLYRHNELLNKIRQQSRMGRTASWAKRGEYSMGKLSKQLLGLLKPYCITSPVSR